MKTQEELFDDLVLFLENEGYNVKVNNDGQYSVLLLETSTFILGAATESDEVNQYLSGKVALDHVDCFDKWSKCPLNLPLPSTQTQYNFLKEQIEFWSSPEGLNVSNDYQTDKWVRKYPKEIR